MNKKTQNYLRWIAVPFASIAGAMLFHLFFKVVTNLAASSFFIGTPPQLIQYIIDCVLEATTGAGFVITGAYTAPNYRIRTATILTIIFAILTIALATFIVIKWKEMNSPVWYIISCISALIGAITASAEIKESSER